MAHVVRFASAGSPRQSRDAARGAEAPRRAVFEPPVPSSPERARQAIDHWAERGFESIEVRGPIRAEVFAAVIDAALSRGLTVAGKLGRPGHPRAGAPGTQNAGPERHPRDAVAGVRRSLDTLGIVD